MLYRLLPSLLALSACASLSAQTIVQQWTFDDTEDGTANLNSTSGQGFGFIADVADTVLNDGAYTVTRGTGFAGDTPLGQTFTSGYLMISITLSSFDYTQEPEAFFGARFRIDETNTTVADLRFSGQTGSDFDDRVRLTGTKVGGIVLDVNSSNEPITYGMVIDIDNGTYTYWVGTPRSGAATWANRFSNNYTGPLSVTEIDAVQWVIQNTTEGNYSVTIDEVTVSFSDDPIIPLWAGYEINNEGWVDTGSWLNWLYVMDDPWIWSDDLQNWMYLPESSVMAAGSWSYVIAP